MLSLFFIWRAKSSWETFETEDSNIVRTSDSPVCSCVFFKKSEISFEVWIVNEHRVIAHRSDLVELFGLINCVCIWLGQVAKLRDACAELRVSCAFRTGKYGKIVDWKVVSKWPCRNSRDGWNMRREKARWRETTHVQRTFLAPLSHACMWHVWRCVNVMVHALCAEKLFVQQVSLCTCRPLNCENVKSPKQTPPLSGACEGDDGVGMFQSFACGARSTHDAIPVLLRPCFLIALRAALYLPPLHCLDALRTGGWVPLPELRGIRAAVQFFQQSAEPCAAPPTSPFITPQDCLTDSNSFAASSVVSVTSQTRALWPAHLSIEESSPDLSSAKQSAASICCAASCVALKRKPFLQRT